VAPDNEPQLGRHREYHVKVRRWQQQLTLLLKPRGSAVRAALPAGAISTRMVLLVLRATGFARNDVATHVGCAAPCNIAQGTSLTWQHSSTEPCQVIRPVPANHVG
jgi:hypothetical protein